MPDALLFVTPDCPHCAVVLRALEDLHSEGLIDKVQVLDATEHPVEVKQYGVRSAPWLRLGPFTLTGTHSLAELRQWTGWAYGEEGIVRYVEHLLKQGDYQQAVSFIAADPQRLEALLAILADVDAGIDVRLGASAMLERYRNMPELQRLLPQLAELARHADHRVRADACHLLGLTACAAARSHLIACLDDESAEVREIAGEALVELEKQ